MTCEKCHAEVPSESMFCGACGHQVAGKPQEDIHRRIARLESAINENAKENAKEQKYLDMETTERIVSRVVKWSSIFGAAVAIPTALLLATLGLFFRHEMKSLYDLADSIDKSVRPAIEKANVEAVQAKAAADDALNNSKQVAQDIGKTKQNLQQLDESVKISQSRVGALNASLEASNGQIQKLRQEASNAILAGDSASIGQAYPTFGPHAVRTSQGGFFDSKSKKLDDVYIDISVSLRSLTPDPKLQDRIAHFMATLQAKSYHFFPAGGIVLSAISGQTHQDIADIGPNSCEYLAKLSGPPCLLYFQNNKEDARTEIIKGARVVQQIADDHIKYIDPSKVEPLRKELLEKSGLDFFVVFDAP